MNATEKQLAALASLLASIEASKVALVDALIIAGYPVDRSSTVRALVRLARRKDAVSPALVAFEAAVRPALATYVAATPRARRTTLVSDAQFLVEHFDQFTEVPIHSHPVKRVLTWARRNYRAWRKADP